MDITKAKNRNKREIVVDMDEVKHTTENLLNLKVNQFELETIRSDKIKKLINSIVRNEAVKHGPKSKIACLIRFENDARLPKLSTKEYCDKLQNAKKIKRRALSPNFAYTYIGFSHYDTSSLRNKQNEKYKLKRIKVVVKPKDKDIKNNDSLIEEEDNTKMMKTEEKKNILSSMMK